MTRIGGIPPFYAPPVRGNGMACLPRLIWAHFGSPVSVFRGGFRGLHTPLGRVKITQPEGFASARRKGGGVFYGDNKGWLGCGEAARAVRLA